METKTERNWRVQKLYDELMAEGKHGHYETMFRVVRLEVERECEACANECKKQAERQHMRFSGTFASGAESCEQAIRSRSNAK